MERDEVDRGWADVVDQVEVECPPPKLTLPAPTAPAPPTGFSSRQLVATLTAPAAPPRPARPASASGRRLLLVAVIGAIAFGAALWVARLSPPSRIAPRVRPDPRGVAGVPAAKEVVETAPPTAPPVAAPVGPGVLSVLSQPPGAWVQIDGVQFGQTPLIMPSPSSLGVSVTLRHEGYRTWSDLVKPDERGHYPVNVQLEAIQR